MARPFDVNNPPLPRPFRLFNSPLIDLFVEPDGVRSEVDEVKTGIGRQVVYTAIEQSMTHATTSPGEPANEASRRRTKD
jgi:hypothetical protein